MIKLSFFFFHREIKFLIKVHLILEKARKNLLFQKTLFFNIALKHIHFLFFFLEKCNYNTENNNQITIFPGTYSEITLIIMLIFF